jgi:hypothetical protein
MHRVRAWNVVVVTYQATSFSMWTRVPAKSCLERARSQIEKQRMGREGSGGTKGKVVDRVVR